MRGELIHVARSLAVPVDRAMLYRPERRWGFADGSASEPKSRARWTISSGVCLLVTVNVPLDWAAMIGTLRPKGRMYVVGAVLEPIPVNSMDVS